MKNLFENLIKESITGRVIINDNYYKVGFNTNIISDGEVRSFRGEENLDFLFPTLQINDYDTFMYYLCDYVLKAKNFYAEEIGIKYNDFSDRDINLLLMTLVWSNATSYDFNNPIKYLQRRINFLDERALEDISNVGQTDSIDAFDDSVIEYRVEKAPLLLETPYLLKVNLRSDDNAYQLPDVFFGLDGDDCYIYAVQNRNNMGNDLNHYQKSIRRKLNKVKKRFDSDDNLDIMSIGDVEKFNINYPENITSVDPSFLCSMTVGIALFNNMGITKIIVPDFFPVRHNAKLIANSIRANFKFGEEKESFLVDSEIKQDRINRNIVDKKIRLFRRLSSHFEFLSIDNYPKELDDSLYMSINEDYCCNNEVLNDVYTKTANSINEINKHKR